ncbi:MAG: Dihydroorotate dehydrogenase B (NAD(+)), catalytic subunit [Candidatus Hydrogenedentes bacterium ADurb.Bin101]|nr:dihydroorotate dehydrogenase-like protein [Candidatus Hydrogenedentota bacterium]OQC06845.1 MAG: Dihydroorotate dehydrogenase B (NAD(+)), catalytic subunit [Candidatus Hydrogenedentes bacterium ADurb.Bin101]
MDLTTKYLGFELKNPLVVSPSPQCESLDNVKRMEDAGAAAVVLHSLFEEQIAHLSHELNANLQQGEESFAEALSYFPDAGEYRMGPDTYIEYVRQVKAAVGVPVIGSLNGVSKGGWLDFAKQIEEAGADALELNVYFIPTNPDMDCRTVENLYIDLVRDVKAAISIPVAVKVGPYFSAFANMAKKLDEAGADALVLFNRFYQPDLNLETLEVKADLMLSSPGELRPRLRWVAILCSLIKADMAITGGVHTAEDVLKCMMAGAKVAMMTSALLKNGIGHLGTVRDAMAQWMEKHEYDSVRQMQGSLSQGKCAEPAAFERANYLKILKHYTPSL